MRNKIAIALVIGLIVALIGVSGYWRQTQPSGFRVAIVSIVEIEPISQLRTGFRREFENSDFAKQNHVTFTEYNAQGDSGLINQIADKISVEKPNLVYVLGTPIAQAIQKRSPELLIVQGAVTDPVEAGLADSWNGSGKKYVATSDLPPIEKQIDLISTLTPNVKSLGIIYNPGESNSVAVVSRIRSYLSTSKKPIDLVERSIANSSDVATAVQSFIGNVDAIYLPPDNTAHAAIPVIGRFAGEQKIPLYATVSSAISDGALATLSLDFEELGKESAELALSVLAGADPAAIPIRVNEHPSIRINAKVAEELGVNLGVMTGRADVQVVK